MRTLKLKSIKSKNQSSSSCFLAAFDLTEVDLKSEVLLLFCQDESSRFGSKLATYSRLGVTLGPGWVELCSQSDSHDYNCLSR